MLEEEFMPLVCTYPEFLDNTIIKPEYLIGKYRTLFIVLKEDRKIHKEFVIVNLMQNKNFDINLFTEQISNNVFFANKETKFIELEKSIIERYKDEQTKTVLNKYNNFKEIFEHLKEIDDINYNENQIITAQDMYDVLKQNNKQIEIGYPNLDRSLNLSEKDLLILAGGTGTGKTAFALNILDNLSNKYQCIYFNMEMSKNILYKRLIAIKSQITLKELNNINNLPLTYKTIVKEKMNEIEKNHIILVNKSMGCSEIKKTIINTKTNKHIVAIIDHIGLINGKGNSLYEKMTNTAKELRKISLDLDCTVIGLCQVSRESQKNETMPKLQDLRDSGEIEQSARKVLMLYNDTENKEDRLQNIKIIIAKNDDGNKLIKDFTFDRLTQIYEEKVL